MPAPKAPHSLEFSTTVSARGITPAQAVIEHITACEARLRSVVFLDHNAQIEFPFGMQGRPFVIVRGRAISRAQKGPRFTYRIVLERMSPSEADELARTVNDVHRRQAISRTLERAIEGIPTTDSLTRSSVRVSVQFPVQYRTAKENYKSAKAGDVSCGGLSINCKDALVEGMPVELRFTLPSDVLEIYPEETAVFDLRKREVTRSTANDLRREFEEIVVLARVVSHQPLVGGGVNYGLAFHNLSGFEREEIARYAHAAQLAKRRSLNK